MTVIRLLKAYIKSVKQYSPNDSIDKFLYIMGAHFKMTIYELYISFTDTEIGSYHSKSINY